METCAGWDAGVDRSEKPMLPLVSINTTAGTAAEMTRFSIITDETRQVKMAIIDRCVPSCCAGTVLQC